MENPMAVLNKTIKGLAFAVLAVAALTGCRIDAPTYPFKIKVVNADGIPIQSCVVTATVDVANHRDEADFEFKRWDNDQQRKASLLIAALGNSEAVNKKDSWDDNINAIASLLEGWLD